MDLPGCGFSQRVEAPECTLAGDAESVLRFMDHFGIESADVVASSRGGGLSIVLAALLAQRGMSHRIRRMVLVSPINPWSSYGRFLTRLLATALGGFFVLHVLPKLHFLMTRYVRKLYGDPQRISPGTVEGYAAGLKPAGSFENLLRVVRSWNVRPGKSRRPCRRSAMFPRYCSGARATAPCIPPRRWSCNAG